MNNIMSLLTISALRKIYKTGTEDLEVLKKINLNITEGTTVLVTGESGSGKSTLLNMIGGLDDVTAGEIEVDRIKITELDEFELTDYRNKVIGFIFQFHYLLKDFTALENIMMPCIIANVRLKQARTKALKLLHDVGLEKRKDHYPSQLSGGERQRVAVARALINEPKLILADEPTGNLDEKNSDIVLNLLFELVTSYHKTMVMVTHDTGIINRSDESYLLEHGVLKRQ
jgi:lipoprotein-releasing system ATP-binding protein